MKVLTTLARPRRRAAGLLVAGLLASTLVGCGPSGPPPGPLGRDVILVGNNVSGTVSFIDERTYDNLGSLDVVPDLEERLAEIAADPERGPLYPVMKQLQALRVREPGQGDAAGDRLVDDLMVSPNGRTLYVSRSNLGDVVAFDLTDRDHEMLWRFRTAGLRADHATLSPDGRRLVVSATTADIAQVVDTATGQEVGRFPTGHFPHQNDYSADGSLIYNASIGDVVLLGHAQNDQKGARQVTVVDAETYEVVDVHPFEYGVRPAVFTPDGTTMFAQLSYLNGLVRYDLASRTIVDTVELPASDVTRALYPEFDLYPHDSAQHGLALSGDGSRLCSAGTITDQVAIVGADDLDVERVVPGGELPYWAITSRDGTKCIVSNAGSGDVSVIDYATGAEVARVPAGTYAGRSRLARIPTQALWYLDPAPG
jgi:YVTN family beta-propeller protein